MVSPVIISASRATDIPKWYSYWFINRLESGSLIWVNPFNNKDQVVSFDKTRVIVFWTKDPTPMIRSLSDIDELGINYYFQYTLNDYENESLEPYLPKLSERVNTFKILSDKIGKEKVIWRFDPLILSDYLSVDDLLSKINRVGDYIHDYTEKLVISFADINKYKMVKYRLGRLNKNYREFTQNEMVELVCGLYEINKKWNLSIGTCAERWPDGIDLSNYNITHNRCIDDNLLRRLFPNDTDLMKFLNESSNQKTLFTSDDINKLKDKNQRKECGCIMSKDIGQYDTCMNGCVYCYAKHD